MGNSSLAIRELPETERTVAFGSITVGFSAVGAVLAHPSIKYVLQNETNQAVSFSVDGTNSFITLYPGKSFTSDVQTNKGRGEAMCAAQGTQFYAKYLSAPASGAIYISTWYGANFNNL